MPPSTLLYASNRNIGNIHNTMFYLFNLFNTQLLYVHISLLHKGSPTFGYDVLIRFKFQKISRLYHEILVIQRIVK